MQSLLIKRAAVLSTRAVAASSQIRGFASLEGLRESPLNAWHVENGGKMGPYAGWALPLQYAEPLKESHLHTREKASVFDVSHMQKLRLHGKDRAKFLERVTVADLGRVAIGNGAYTLLLNESGGVIDDSVFNVFEDHIYMVVNAGCAEKDLAHLTEQVAAFQANGGDVAMEPYDGALVALQGPSAAAVLSNLCDINLRAFPFMQSQRTSLGGLDALVTRCGYTGEDGFEIGVPSGDGVKLMEMLTDHADVLPAGLAVRDTLRLEAGLCLYGNDLSEDISPIEAGLNWTISKRRREEGGFIGHERVMRDLTEGVSRKRVGFVLEKGICRDGVAVEDVDGNEIGFVCSGTFSPSLNQGIGMAYVKKGNTKSGTSLKLRVRTRLFDGTVTKMPFVPTNYFSAEA